MEVNLVERLRAAAVGAGFEVQSNRGLEEAVLIARRARWQFTAHMHTFLVAYVEDGLSAERADTLTDHAVQFAITHKGGLPRGLQTGTVTVAIFIGSSPSIADWFASDPKQRYAALRFPVLVDPKARSVTYFERRMSRGSVFGAYLRDLVDHTVTPALLPDR